LPLVYGKGHRGGPLSREPVLTASRAVVAGAVWMLARHVQQSASSSGRALVADRSLAAFQAHLRRHRESEAGWDV